MHAKPVWDSLLTACPRPLLEANHRYEAREGCRFFQYTLDHARRHAREEFGCDGLKWDWEITHDGRKAYGTLLHMKFQVHNNGSYANMIWGMYQYAQDRDFLRDYYPILEGMAQFYLDCIVEETADGFEIGEQVGVHESPEKVRNDGMNVAATIAILHHCAEAARVLDRETAFTQRCDEVASSLMRTMNTLYNGEYFRASEGNDLLNMSSIGPIYPMNVIEPKDPRAVSTALAFVDKYKDRAIGHGGSSSGFPWAAGVLGSIVARQGNADLAWRIIDNTRPAICIFGGMSEVLDNGQWNMQYFGTAQGAVCAALHHVLLQVVADDTILVFPAVPSAWESAAFETLLAAGFTVSARLDESGVACTVHNSSSQPLTRHIQFGDTAHTVTLAPDESYALNWDR